MIRTPAPRSTRGLALVAALIGTAGLAHAQVAPTRPRAAAPTRDDTVPALTRPLSIGDAARLAASQSTGALAAGFQTQEALARVSQARANLLPNLNASTSQSQRTFNSATLGLNLPTGTDPATGRTNYFFPINGEILGPVKVFDLRAAVATPIVDPAGIARYRAAQVGASAATAQQRNAAEQAASGAASAYVQVLRADAVLAARLADSTLAVELLRIAQQQLQAGVGVGIDVTRAQSQLATIRAQILTARNDGDRARLTLDRALGLPTGTAVPLTDSLTRLPIADTPPDENSTVELALRNRPDLQATDQQLRASRAQLRAIRAEALPSLALTADDGLNGPNPAHLLNTYDFGVAIQLPIFDSFRRAGREQEQQAASRVLEVQRRDLRQQAATDVRAALLDLGSAREQVAAAQERVRLAEQEVTQARERFTAGVAGNADIVTASLDLNAARSALVDALALYQNARVALARSTGSVTTLP